MLLLNSSHHFTPLHTTLVYVPSYIIVNTRILLCMEMPSNFRENSKKCVRAVGKFAISQRGQKNDPPLILSFKLDSMRLSRHM